VNPPLEDRRPPRRTRGIALIAVLWIVMLLAVIAGSLTMLTRTELDLTRNLTLSAEAEALAEGGAYLAINQLLAPNSSLLRLTGHQAWRVETETGNIDIAVADVMGRIDLNTAEPEVLAGLFAAAGAEPETAEVLADRIVDWRDTDDTPRPNGAEQADYADLDPPIEVGNGPFLAADEIMRVPGMTMALWTRIADSVTVHSLRPGINPLYASPLALMALPGVEAETVQEVVETREETEQKTIGGIPAIAEIAGMFPAEARPYLAGGSSNMYNVRVRAELAEGAVYVLDAVIEITPTSGQPWQIHEWRPGNVG
jgi:general secretion pathway protein K